MGAEWVSELSTHNGVEGNTSAPFSYQNIFNEHCPYYMSIGMSYDEFWYGDVIRTVAYRKAEKIRKDKLNEQLWLQGMYFYEALCDVAPVLVTIPKKGANIIPFVTEPYALSEAERKKKEERLAKERQDAMLKKFMAQATKININKFSGGGNNG